MSKEKAFTEVLSNLLNNEQKRDITIKYLADQETLKQGVTLDKFTISTDEQAIHDGIYEVVQDLIQEVIFTMIENEEKAGK